MTQHAYIQRLSRAESKDCGGRFMVSLLSSHGGMRVSYHDIGVWGVLGNYFFASLREARACAAKVVGAENVTVAA